MQMIQDCGTCLHALLLHDGPHTSVAYLRLATDIGKGITSCRTASRSQIGFLGSLLVRPVDGDLEARHADVKCSKTVANMALHGPGGHHLNCWRAWSKICSKDVPRCGAPNG